MKANLIRVANMQTEFLLAQSRDLRIEVVSERSRYTVKESKVRFERRRRKKQAGRRKQRSEGWVQKGLGVKQSRAEGTTSERW